MANVQFHTRADVDDVGPKGVDRVGHISGREASCNDHLQGGRNVVPRQTRALPGERYSATTGPVGMPPIKEQTIYGGSQGLHRPRHVFGVSNPNSLPDGPRTPPTQLLGILTVLLTMQLDYGSAGQPGSADGQGPDARFNQPTGIAIEPETTARQLASTSPWFLFDGQPQKRPPPHSWRPFFYTSGIKMVSFINKRRIQKI